MLVIYILEILQQRDRLFKIIEVLLKEIDDLRRENIRLKIKEMEVNA